jgi:peptidyl-prolyl cis-trans isomerase SurA
MTVYASARACLCGALIAATLASATPAVAQGLFGAVATVDGGAITGYELDQRMLLLRAFRAPGDLRKEALDALIQERLQNREARRLKLTVTPGEIVEGETEFASRANVDRETFIASIGAGGVAPETFRDFVTSGVLWRKVIAERFGGRIAVSENEIDRFLADDGRRPGVRALLSEIILPADTPEAAARAQALAGELATITSQAAFEAAAREYSAAPSRERGGQIDWIPLSNLPAPLAALVLPLAPGGVAGPIQVPNAVVLFQLRGLQEVPDLGPDTRAIDYATLLIPGGRSAQALSEAAAIRAGIDTCGDLNAVARQRPDLRLDRQAVPPSQLSADIAAQIATLDGDEVSTALTRGSSLVFLMLCDRIPVREAEVPSRSRAADILVNRRASKLADGYLAELRANATIVTP